MGKWGAVPGVELVGVIGHGGSSTVFLGTQPRFGRRVAVKVLHSVREGDLYTRLFRTECETLGRFSSHPNILTLFDAGFTGDDRPYLVTEYLPAGTLEDRVREEGPLAWAEVADIGVQLAGALESAHREGVVHGDVKASNVLVGRMGQPVLSDFGVARLRGGAGAMRGPLTPLHAAPELLDGAEPSPLSDVWGLGTVLFELLDGEPAFGSRTDPPLVVLRRVAEGERRSLTEDAAPAALGDVVQGCLSTAPGDRPATAAIAGEQLRAAQSAAGVERSDMPVLDSLALDGPTIEVGEPPEPPEPAATTLPPPSAVPWAVYASAAAVVLVGVVAWFVLWGPGGDGSTDPARDPEVAGAAQSREVASAPGDTPSSTLPESALGGVQPGVEVLDGPDRSPALAAQLAEEHLIVAELAALLPGGLTESPFYGLYFTELPAAFHYQGFNSRGGEECTGMMTRELELDGLWERSGTWPGGRFQISVGQLADAAQAHELYTAASLGVSADPTGCFGMAPFGVEDYDDYGVIQRDLGLRELFSTGARYNTWYAEDVAIGPDTYPHSLRVVLEDGPYVVDVVILDDGTLPRPREVVIASVLNQVRARL